MKAIDPKVRDDLYSDALRLHFERAVLVVLESRKNTNQKAAALFDVVKLAYQSGCDRGYDMGFHVFGEE